MSALMHFIDEFQSQFEVLDILQRDLRNLLKRFARQKSLMRSHENIGKREQSSEYVILKDLVGQIIEEDSFFLFINIQSSSPEVPRLQGFHEGCRIDQRASSRIEKNHSWFRLGKYRSIDHVP